MDYCRIGVKCLVCVTVLQVHALNILRALYRDTRLGENIVSFVSEGMQAAVLGFTSPVWAVSPDILALFTVTCLFFNFLECLLLEQSCWEDITHIRFTTVDWFLNCCCIYFFFFQGFWTVIHLMKGEKFHFNSFSLSRDALNGRYRVQICCHVSFGNDMVLIIYC